MYSFMERGHVDPVILLRKVYVTENTSSHNTDK